MSGLNNLLQLKTGQSRKITTDSVTLGRYTFQPNRQLLSDGNEDRRLSYRETELLKLLCENKNTIIGRKEILNTLWNSDSFFNSRTLDVYITKLRGYLKNDSSLEIITIKSIGYRFLVS